MLELQSENPRTPLTRADITEFLSQLGGLIVVHEKTPTSVDVRSSFKRLKVLDLPVQNRPFGSHDIQERMFLFLERQMFNAYEDKRQQLGRELTDEEMFQNGIDAIKEFRFFHGWALFDSQVWLPHVWVCKIDPVTIEAKEIIDVGDELATRYVGASMRLFDAANINNRFGPRTPDDARQAFDEIRDIENEDADEDEQWQQDEWAEEWDRTAQSMMGEL